MIQITVYGKPVVLVVRSFGLTQDNKHDEWAADATCKRCLTIENFTVMLLLTSLEDGSFDFYTYH